jgi:hypothetical protein
MDTVGPLSAPSGVTKRARAARDFVYRRLSGGQPSACPTPQHVGSLLTLRHPVTGGDPAR